MTRRAGTVALVAGLAAVHVATGALAWRAGMVEGAWAAFVAERADALLIAYGGAYGPWVREGAVWRVATAPWVHGSGAHLAVNALALAVFGGAVEPDRGPGPVIGVVVASAVAGVAGALAAGTVLLVGASAGALGLAGWIARTAEVPAVRRVAALWAAAAVAVSVIDPASNAVAHGVGLAVGLAWAGRGRAVR